MKNLSSEVLEQIREAIKRQEGTMAFEYITEENLFDPKVPGGIIFHTTSGEHYFRLERTNDAEIQFYHSSPGTGTRVASVNLRDLTPSKKVFVVFSWSPAEIQLHIGPRGENEKLVSSVGVVSEISFRVGKDGSIVQVGSPGVQVMGTRVNIGGKQVIKPTAIDAWNETKKAIEILLTGESKEGFIFETVKVNLSIVMMVTGFEAYCKTRYQEIEGEGIFSNSELVKEKLEKSKENFQDFDGYCKDIFKFGYNIKFFELVKPDEFIRLKQLFVFRSRIVHVSPMISMVNEFEIPKEEPIFSTNIINEALALFDKFINELHKASLELRRKD